MGYNVLSGNVLLPGQLLADGQVSSSAFVGDGKELEHVLKITSNPDRYNLTTIGTDSYKLTGESNLTFNSNVLTVTGEVSASVGISSSFFIGDGRFLTNVPGSGGGGGTGGGTGGGWFTNQPKPKSSPGVPGERADASRLWVSVGTGTQVRRRRCGGKDNNGGGPPCGAERTDTERPTRT